jgi:hypothetical protein
MGTNEAQGDGKQEIKERKNAFGRKRQEKFLTAFASSCNLTEACEHVRVHRSTVFLRRRSDPAFKAAYETAREQAVVNLESELIRRGIALIQAATPQESASAAMPGLDAKTLLSLIQIHRRHIGKEPGHSHEQRSDPDEAAGRLHALMLRLRLQRAREEEENQQASDARDARRGS